MNIGEAITAVAILWAGIILIAYSIKLFRRIRVIKNSDEVSISESIHRNDIVQIGGKVHDYEELLKSPVENQVCVAYDYTISKSTRDHADPENDIYWKDLEEEKEIVDFILEDHTGTAHIQTDGSEVSLTHDSRHTTSDSSSATTTVTGDPIPFDLMKFDFDDRLRFKEGTIKPGDWIFVIGKFGDGEMKNGPVIDSNSKEIVYICDKDAKNEIGNLRTPAVTGFIFGSVFILFLATYIILEVL
ncbi:hypothetical protein G6M89_15705 [Natronolimnobius sp. AArcel1]|uniref:hypothetical protein n=1 Tax=Natronolimnobius sp. AArcel1 TaxID=1679093 RepID=UPI0013EB8D20|nr:hypothetical protein [Natronolimnobius sp. AArcel1]NGM70428.1 hypothetical protein [Natronolimnobius sp. AArcel1]